jgi:UDP-N-acetylglucosamine diphosphorylase/glucosamine-1-phosphate N-acetyltransferase
MIIIIMAGGLGKRMDSNIPKVLHEVVLPNNTKIKYPMLIHVILTAIKLNPKKIFIIVGKFKEIISQTISNYISNQNLIEYVEQTEALGTGHAIKCCLPFISNFIEDNAIILSGDVPLISPKTLANLIGQTNKILITKLIDPTGCGRIIFSDKQILKIVEQKDCSDSEKLIQYVNCGIYQIKVKDLNNLIPLITNNNKSNEYYLTDIIDLMIQNNIPINTWELADSNQYEIKNVNTKIDLEELNNFITSFTPLDI